MKKNILYLLTAAIVILSLSACNSSNGKSEGEETESKVALSDTKEEKASEESSEENTSEEYSEENTQTEQKSVSEEEESTEKTTQEPLKEVLSETKENKTVNQQVSDINSEPYLATVKTFFDAHDGNTTAEEFINIIMPPKIYAAVLQEQVDEGNYASVEEAEKAANEELNELLSIPEDEKSYSISGVEQGDDELKTQVESFLSEAFEDDVKVEDVKKVNAVINEDGETTKVSMTVYKYDGQWYIDIASSMSGEKF